MNLDKMKSWITQKDICTFIEDSTVTNTEWLTVHEKRYSLYEQYNLVPILLGPKQIQNSMDNTGWSREYKNSKPKLIIPDRSRFLCKAFYNIFPDLNVEMDGLNLIYKEKENSEILKIIYEKKDRAINIRRDILSKFLKDQNRFLVLGVQCTRYSERPLNELGLRDAMEKFSNNNFGYTLATRVSNTFTDPDRRMFSTVTQILGKKQLLLNSNV